MRIFVNYEKQKVSKIEQDQEMYFGENNVDVVRVLINTTSLDDDFYVSLGAKCSNNRDVNPRLSDTLTTTERPTETIDGVVYTCYDFTLSQDNGWYLSEGLTNFFVWFNWSDTSANKCVGSARCNILVSGTYYQVDNISVNPALKSYLDDTFDDMKEDLEDEIEENNKTQTSLINNFVGGEPRYIDTSSNILSLTSNQGVAVGTDTGHWYYWNGSSYADGGVYQATAGYDEFNERISLLNSGIDVIHGEFLTGGIGGTGDIETNLTNRRYCVEYQFFDRPITLKIESGYAYTLAIYDSDKSMVSRTNTTVSKTIPANTYFRVAIFKSDESKPSSTWDLVKRLTFSNEISYIDDNVTVLKDILKKYIKTDITFIDGYNVKLSVGVGNVVDLTPEEVTSYRYAILDCNEGDSFIINGIGGSNPRLWGFIDSENVLLSVADSGENVNNDLLITAPKNASKLIINDSKSGRLCYSGAGNLSDDINNLREDVDDIIDNDYDFGVQNLLEQSNNIINSLGIDLFKEKAIEVSKPNKYSAWSFISSVDDKLVCIYSRGYSHEDNTNPDIYVRVSSNGIIWSDEKKIISTYNTRDTITGKGNDSNDNMIFWNRVGAPGASTSYHELYRTSDGFTFEKISSPSFDTLPGHIGDIIYVENVGLIAFFNTFGTSRSWGFIKSTDEGLTWEQTIIESGLTVAECPTEISAAYLGNGKIIAIGRKEASSTDGTYAMFQIQSSDYGTTWTKKYTNITDISLSTPSIIYDSGSNNLKLYYYKRGEGLLKCRIDSIDAVWDNPTNWSSSKVIVTASTSYQDAGNVNAVSYNGNDIVTYYSGDSENTGIYSVIV